MDPSSLSAALSIKSCFPPWLCFLRNFHLDCFVQFSSYAVYMGHKFTQVPASHLGFQGYSSSYILPPAPAFWKSLPLQCMSVVAKIKLPNWLGFGDSCQSFFLSGEAPWRRTAVLSLCLLLTCFLGCLTGEGVFSSWASTLCTLAYLMSHSRAEVNFGNHIQKCVISLLGALPPSYRERSACIRGRCLQEDGNESSSNHITRCISEIWWMIRCLKDITMKDVVRQSPHRKHTHPTILDTF